MKGLLVLLLLLTCSGVADVKMRVRVQRGKMPVREGVHYAKGQRQRIETPNAPLIRITQCDLKRAVLLNPYTKRYLVIDFQKVASEFDQSAVEISETAARSPAESGPRTCGGTVHVKQKITEFPDTAEIAGVRARHLRIVANFNPDPDACHPAATSINDGWYADVGTPTACRIDEGYAGITGPTYAGGDHYIREGDRLEPNLIAMRTVSEHLPLHQTPPEDAERNATKREVTELSIAPLDESLFEVPADYREVKTRSELFSQDNAAGASQSGPPVPGKIYELGSGVTAPNPIRTPPPEYTDAARRARVTGTVVVGLVVGTDGHVQQAWVEHSLRPDLDQQSLSTVRQWLFEPGKLNGEPVAVSMHVETTFRLR